MTVGFGLVGCGIVARDHARALEAAEGARLVAVTDVDSDRARAFCDEAGVAFCASYEELPRPFRRYQIGPSWRGERPQRGRYREFVQADIDIVGSASMLADAEIITITIDALERLEKIYPPKKWSKKQGLGPRKIVREDQQK